jgi:hypothetical protein
LDSQGWFRVTAQGQASGEGSSRIHPATPSVQIQFEECNEKSLKSFYLEIIRNIHREVSYRMIPESFVRCYGLEGGRADDYYTSMSFSRFLRSLFVLFRQQPSASSTGTAADAAAAEWSTRTAPVARTPEEGSASISMARTLIDVRFGEKFVRMKMYFRFYTNANENVEVCLRGKHYVS